MAFRQLSQKHSAAGPPAEANDIAFLESLQGLLCTKAWASFILFFFSGGKKEKKKEKGQALWEAKVT